MSKYLVDFFYGNHLVSLYVHAESEEEAADIVKTDCHNIAEELGIEVNRFAEVIHVSVGLPNSSVYAYSKRLKSITFEP